MTEQLDYIYFFYGLGFILLAAICFLSPFFDKKQMALPWRWLGLFGLIHGLSEWQDVLALSLGNTLTLKAAHICLMALSFVCLVEFGRLGTKAVTGRGPGRWITVVLFVIGCTGWLYGWVGVDVFFRYSLGFVGGVWSAAALILAARHPENQDQRRSLIALGLLLATYALTGGLLVPQALFLPAFLLTRDSFLQTFGFPIHLIQGLSALASAMCAWQILVSQRTGKMYRVAFVCLLPAILVCGWFFTNREGISEQQEWMSGLHSTCTISAASISPKLAEGIDSIEDINNPRYVLLKESLVNMRDAAPEFRYIYLMVVRNGRIIFSADSEPVSSKDYSPPGDEYTDAPAELRALGRGERHSATADYKDRWGQWVSAFVPVRDDTTGKPVAILGMDYPKAKVHQAVLEARLHSIASTLLVALLTILLFYFRERRERFNTAIAEGVKSLQDKEERLSCTLRSIGDAVISTDANGRVVAMNPVAEELTGLALSESAGLPISEVLNVVNTLTGDSAFIPVDEVLSTGEICHLADHTTLIARDGTKRQIADSAAPIRDSWGKITGVVLVFSDVTEQYRMRNELSASEARLHTLVQTIPDLIWLKDKDGVFLSCNTTFQRFFGASEADIVGKTDYDFVDRELADSFRENDLIAMAAGKPSSNEEWITFADDGQRVLLDTTKTPMFDSQGVLIGVLGIGRDITERKQSEEALRESNLILSTQQETTLDGILIVDPAGKVISGNHRFVDMWGIPSGLLETLSDELIMKSVLGKLAEPEQFIAGVQSLYEDIDATSQDEIDLADGRVFYRYSAPMKDADGIYYGRVWYFRDITESKQAEEALRESEGKHRALFVSIADSVFIIDQQTGRILDANAAACQTYGYTHEEFIQLCNTDISAEPEETVRAIRELDLFIPLRYHKSKNGGVFPVEIIINLCQIQGRPVIVASARDITERRRAEKALQDSEATVRSITDSAQDAILMMDSRGEIVFWNPAAERIFGYTEDEALGQNLHEFLVPERYHEAHNQALPGFLQTGRGNAIGQILELHGVRKDNQEITVSLALSAVQKNGEWGAVGILRDITQQKQSEEALRASEERCRQIVETAQEGIWVIDPYGVTLYTNDRMASMLGLSSEEMVGMQVLDLMIDDVGRPTTSPVSDEQVAPSNRDFQLRKSDGSHIWVSIGTNPMFDKDGVYVGALGMVADITERKQAEEALQNEKDNLAAIFASSPVGMLLLDEDMKIIDANSVLGELVSRGLDQILDQRGGGGLGCAYSFENEKGCGFSSACGDCALRQGIAKVLEDGVPVHGIEIQMTLLIGGHKQYPWLRVSAEPITISGRKHVIVAIDDITDRKQGELELIQANAEIVTVNRELVGALTQANQMASEAEQAKEKMEEHAVELSHQATHDSLTGLPNRQYFEQHLGDLIVRSAGKKTRSMTVLFLDLDKFKQINDTLGHKIGDLLLVETGQRLQACLRSEDILARMGGDEFTVILPRCTQRAIAQKVASRMIDSVSRPFEIKGHRFVIGASIGLASYPADGTDTVALLKHADAAMYKAKQSGRGTFCWFSGEVDVENQRRADLEMDIRSALGNNQFRVYYQPIVGLEDTNSISAEALLRWEHPEKGMISPSLFIPIAEEIGAIGQIGEYVLRTACAQTKAWSDEGIHLSQIGVNVSPRQIRDASWFASIKSVLSDTGLHAGRLNLEVTETDFSSDYESMKETLLKARQLGVCLAIDDFGMGQSSLSRLRDFPVIHLKIDGSFIRDIEQNPNDSALIRSIVEMAHSQGIKVTAEWVETEPQMQILRSIGCDYAQGFLISPALPAEDFGQFFSNWMSQQRKAA